MHLISVRDGLQLTMTVLLTSLSLDHPVKVQKEKKSI